MRTDYSGKTVKIKSGVLDPQQGQVVSGATYEVEGYWDEITGGSWMFADGNYAALNYTMRLIINDLPLDNEVLYGKIGGLGHIVHVSEIEV